MKQSATWFTNIRLIINADKMLFHFNKTCKLVKLKTVFKNGEIGYTSEVKVLGINI